MRKGRPTFAVIFVLTAAVAVGSPPRRIVSLVPAVTEMLFAIGAGPQVVGVSSFDRDPPEVTRLPRVGALLDPDLESILALTPDLVVVYGSQDELRTQLARTGTPVFLYLHGGLEGIFDTLQRLGEQTGRADAAKTVSEQLRADLAAVQKSVAGRKRPRVLLVFGRDPDTLRNVWASGGVGFLHELLQIAGGDNVMADVQREGLQVNVEQILARRPEVVLELRADARPDADREALRPWQTLSALTAVRNGRVHFLSGSDLVTPGPRIARATERIARALHRSR
jgi:iron complex transport system substrate-binding protein